MADGKAVSCRMEAKEVRKSLGQHMLVDGLELVLDLEKSHGAMVYDAESGREFVDFFGFFGSAALGLNHPWMHRPEVERDLLRAARGKPSNSDIYTEEMARFVMRFSEEVMPAELPYLFLISGGALAVENALKVAFDWKTRRNAACGVGVSGNRVLHFRHAFHGRTGYTMSLTNTDPTKILNFPKFDWPRVSSPAVVWPLEGENLREVEAREAQCRREMEEAFGRYPDEIAAIIVEPIQAEGGDRYFRKEFFQMLRELADEHSALLIYDEVQSGFGTTGRWWAWQHYGVAPDVVAFGKKAQVCGIMASRRIDEVENHVFAMSSRINSTWGGNLVDMVRSGHIIDCIVEEGLLENVSQRSLQAVEWLGEAQAKMPELVSQVRGLGGMIAFDLPSTAQRGAVIGKAFEKGLLLLACGSRSIRFRPALTMTAGEMSQGLEILQSVLASL